MAALGPGPRADGESLLRSRKRNFSEAEVSALLRCVSARRKKLLAAPEDKVPLWQRNQIWKQVTDAVNAASGFRNRRTPGEVKKKWSDFKIEAKKRLRLATERGDHGALRPTHRRILAILDQSQDQDLDLDCPIMMDQDCPDGTLCGMKLEPGLDSGLCSGLFSGLDSGLETGLDSGLGQPTVGHLTRVKSEPLLSESEPSSTPPSVSTEHVHQFNHVMGRAQSNSITESSQNESFTDHTPMNHVMEHSPMNHFKESSQSNHITVNSQTLMGHTPMNHLTEHTQSSCPDLMLLLLQNQQQILDTLRNMAQTFSQINSNLKDISHSLKNR